MLTYAAASLLHNVGGELETRYVAGYSGLKQHKRERLRRVTNSELQVTYADVC
jgi:hypothetical protein